MDDEVGGVGSVGEHMFIWIMDGSLIDACLESGESLKFINNSDGWTEFLMFAIAATGKI